MAIGAENERHVPGSLKQQNKAHKHGRHKSKGKLETLKRGRVLATKILRKAKHEQNKSERRNQAAQLRHNKRENYLLKKRGLTDAPYLVAMVPLNTNINTSHLLCLFKNADVEAVTGYSPESHLHIGIPKLRKRFSLLECDSGNVLDVLDALKVADCVLFLMSTRGIDTVGEALLTACLAQGLPSTVTAVVDLSSISNTKRFGVKKELHNSINQWLPDEKVIILEQESDALKILRSIGNQKERGIVQRDRRPHLLAEQVEFIPDQQESSVGTVKMTGYLRGQILSVNSLVHIPGWGTFQMKQIDSPGDPHLLGNSKAEVQEYKILAVADPQKQESLDMENVPDPMDAEQTWPTEEEMAEAEVQIKRVKRVPAGMSDYQAAWIPDCDAEEVENELEDDDDDDDNNMECDEARSEEDSDEEVSEEAETMTVTSEAPIPTDKYDQDTNLTEEQETLQKMREARIEQMFPDEVDTPLDIPARVRFQKYRGLQSFRTSPWDPKENLPSDYAKIFQFKNFDKTKKRVLNELGDISGALPGWYITVHVQKVPEALYTARLGSQPLLFYGLLPHEQKMSVLNMVLKRQPIFRFQDPIKSKEQLVFQCGYRRFRASPIFSQHTNGSKHKYERYFQPNSTVVATVFAPITFPPASVLAFKEKKDGTQVLVATGSVLSVNPDRVVVKRVVLSGHPFKVHKRTAVVRFMFFNREDIDWFKPVELRTKYGRRGHIKEPLGTHGHMKCIFDGQLKSQDTALLNLYKRVYPKWTFDNYVQLIPGNISMETV
ncbi:ribosome biogenesis protein tsr1 [Homalodisca vitripennis]|nr:ribosome biogenesis protein tsr1 [Homalodisca vitripennis]